VLAVLHEPSDVRHRADGQVSGISGSRSSGPFARAVRLFGHAAREELATPITSAAAQGLVRLFDDPRLAEELLLW
jgi:hypothetical protein